ncbi:MAG: exodeoxyribonuclease VII large subunit [Gammaproteobacteria bacterium]|nr:MAG: exodeoxyribonuclease VII large subunit [Gammaproteobacteria bacterium]TDJ43166.1 MAG: exodeoxyribonuclease VII large subunit [Gammaproteobacteria bacterium]
MLAEHEDRTTYTVSELSTAVRFLLEERFPLVWVEGEISNLRVPSSGHWYFTLKDEHAQIRCAMFRNRNRLVRVKPDDGMQVMVRGRISLYEARGDFQLIADHIEPSGEGALRAAFEALKQSLDREGLFAFERKRPLPEFPTHVAVISSATGAALRDIVSVFRRRAPSLRVTLLPSAVQGKEAEAQLNRALAQISSWPAELGPAPDVVLLARGGGSIEDLWSFNLESVARSVAACAVPVVSAVGHETDITICDFVADVRAPTPSAGAELIAPDSREFERALIGFRRSLASHAARQVRDGHRDLTHLAKRLTDPRRQLQQQAQRVDDAEQAIRRGARRALREQRSRARQLRLRLGRVHPGTALARRGTELGRLFGVLTRGSNVHLHAAIQRLAGLSRALHAISPLDTLARGYAIVAIPDGSRWGTPVNRVAQVQRGDVVTAHIADGRLSATVTDVQPEPSSGADHND